MYFHVFLSYFVIQLAVVPKKESLLTTRSVQKVLQLYHKEKWKCYKVHFIFQYNPY